MSTCVQSNCMFDIFRIFIDQLFILYSALRIEFIVGITSTRKHACMCLSICLAVSAYVRDVGSLPSGVHILICLSVSLNNRAIYYTAYNYTYILLFITLFRKLIFCTGPAHPHTEGIEVTAYRTICLLLVFKRFTEKRKVTLPKTYQLH